MRSADVTIAMAALHVLGVVVLDREADSAELTDLGRYAMVAALIGRPEDEISAGIMTVIVMVAAKLSPHDAGRQPILRLADTALGVAVGLVAAWLGLRAVRPLTRPAGLP